MSLDRKSEKAAFVLLVASPTLEHTFYCDVLANLGSVIGCDKPDRIVQGVSLSLSCSKAAWVKVSTLEHGRSVAKFFGMCGDAPNRITFKPCKNMVATTNVDLINSRSCPLFYLQICPIELGKTEVRIEMGVDFEVVDGRLQHWDFAVRHFSGVFSSDVLGLCDQDIYPHDFSCFDSIRLVGDGHDLHNMILCYDPSIIGHVIAVIDCEHAAYSFTQGALDVAAATCAHSYYGTDLSLMSSSWKRLGSTFAYWDNSRHMAVKFRVAPVWEKGEGLVGLLTRPKEHVTFVSTWGEDSDQIEIGEIVKAGSCRELDHFEWGNHVVGPPCIERGNIEGICSLAQTDCTDWTRTTGTHGRPAIQSRKE